MNIQTINIDLIKPYWRNPRKNEKAVAAVKESIRKYGYNQPIVVDKKYTIIVGHTRYKALRELGYTEVPVVVLDLPEKKAKQYRIADNKTAEKADWDQDLLMFELREIEELKDMEVFFDEGELDKLLKDMDEELSKLEEEEEELEKELETIQTVKPVEADPEELKRLEEQRRKLQEELRRMQEERERRERERLAEENERIKQKEREMQEQFQRKSEELENDYIEVQCPHCEQKYILSRSELLRSRKV